MLELTDASGLTASPLPTLHAHPQNGVTLLEAEATVAGVAGPGVHKVAVAQHHQTIGRVRQDWTQHHCGGRRAHDA